MKNINIINISDFPAMISDEELNRWLDFLKENKYNIKELSLNKKEKALSILNALLMSNNDEIILFSSWWFDAINNINLVGNNIWNWKKFLIGFSDTLHIQSKFYNYNNIYIVYGITLRNIFHLSNDSKNTLFNFIDKQTFNITLESNLVHNNILTGTLYWWHLMIFINILDIYWIEVLNWDILYLEFHGMEDYFISYYLNVLKVKWVFQKISGVILDKKLDNFDKNKLVRYFSDNGINNIYSLDNIDFLPFYKKITIDWWNIIMTI